MAKPWIMLLAVAGIAAAQGIDLVALAGAGGFAAKVAFQVDDSCETRLFTYKSVTGEGIFEIVTDAGEIERIMPVVVSRFLDTPDWVQAESATFWANGELVLARLRPQVMSGVCNAQSDEGKYAEK